MYGILRTQTQLKGDMSNTVSIITYDDKSFTQLKVLKDKYTEKLHNKSSDYIHVIIQNNQSSKRIYTKIHYIWIQTNDIYKHTSVLIPISHRLIIKKYPPEYMIHHSKNSRSIH